MGAGCYLTAMFMIIAISLSLIASSSAINNSSGTTPLGFHMPLIHRHSPASPFYDPNITALDLIRADQQHMDCMAAQTSYYSRDFDVPLCQHPSGVFLSVFYVGSSWSEVYVHVDTGSPLTWIQCTPCDSCDGTLYPPFNPDSSATYQSIECDMSFSSCRGDYPLYCDDEDNCNFRISYADGSKAAGAMAVDTFSVLNPEGKTKLIPVVFGCANAADKYFKLPSNGILGLGLGPLTIQSQMSVDKFSYCLPPPDHKVFDQLIRFGSEAKLLGTRTWFFTHPMLRFHYTLLMEAITFQSHRFPPEVTDATFDIVIDTGSVACHLPPSLVTPLVKELDKTITLQKTVSKDLHCYLGSLKDVEGLSVTLHFKDGLQITMSRWLFYGFNNIVCLGIVPSYQGFALLGANAQINYNIGYDLHSGEIAFKPMDCTVP